MMMNKIKIVDNALTNMCAWGCTAAREPVFVGSGYCECACPKKKLIIARKLVVCTGSRVNLPEPTDLQREIDRAFSWKPEVRRL
jgi:hypothetical protein